VNQPARFSRGIFLVYTSFVALSALIILAAMFLSPSERGSAILFGLSFSRLVLATGFLLAFLFFAGLFLNALRDPQWVERTLEQWFGGGRFSRWLAWFAVIGLGLGWIGCFLPSYRAGPLGAHWERIQPLMVFLLLTSIATLSVFLVKRIDLSTTNVKFSGLLFGALILFLVGLLVLLWMFASKYGIYAPAEDFWYGAGVPILFPQLLASFLAGVLVLLLRWNWDSGRKDLLVVFVLYVLTAILWAREPLQRSFLFTGPRPPNGVLYPFADAAALDAGSQFALIGQGIFAYNTPFFERPLYLSFLAYLHMLFGQNYEVLMAAQAAVLAIFPAIIYLIGRSLNMRAVGVSAALVTMFRGLNSIAASSLIDLASPKMILTDFPTAIGVALVILFTCEWLKKPGQRLHYAVWVGGAIGLGLMLRTNALLFLIFIPLYAIFRFIPNWKGWLISSILIFLGVVAITLPWELRNVARGGVMYSPIVTKIQSVIRTRYQGQPQGSAPLQSNLSAFTFQQTSILSSLYEGTDIADEQPCNSILCFAPKHFLHNAAMSLLSLPTSPVLNDLRHTVKADPSYWKADWDGKIASISLFLLIVNLFMTVLGISVIWKYQRLPGMVPLAVFAVYNLSNSMARTSGGRYIAPMDWILLLYFMAGILYLFAEFARIVHFRQVSIFEADTHEEKEISTGSSWRKVLGALIIVLAIGMLAPLSERLTSPRYAGFDIPATVQKWEPQIIQAGLDPEQLNAFLESPGAEALVGRTLYPRSYKMGQGEISFYFYPFVNMEFPRTGFFLIGLHGQDNIILAGGFPKYLPHLADTLVIGCRDQNYVDALMVIVLDNNGTAYTRSPVPAELTCPMKLPVCNNNSKCQ
jgi:hypothetical protein